MRYRLTATIDAPDPASAGRQAGAWGLMGVKVTMLRESAAPAVVDTRTMTEAAMRAWFHRTAPTEDARFVHETAQRGELSAALVDAGARLLTSPVTAAAARAYADAWRTERTAWDVAHGMPAIGSERWHAVQRSAVAA